MSLPDGYTAHQAADWFPMFSEEKMEGLASDIEEHGLVQPITLTPDGLILDGRNRLVACDLMGVEPTFETYEGDDPVGYVISKNVKRRDLSKQQMAIVAARALHSFEERAAARQTSGKKLPKGEKGKAVERAAKAFGVNAEYIRQAKVVLERSPEKAEEMLTEPHNSFSLSAAYHRLTAEEHKTNWRKLKQESDRTEEERRRRREEYRATMLKAEAALAAPADLLEQMEMGVLSAEEVIDRSEERFSLADWIVTTVQRINEHRDGSEPSDVAFALYSTEVEVDAKGMRSAGQFLISISKAMERLQ